MKTLNDMRHHLYRNYLNCKDPILIIKNILGARKIEMGYLDDIIMLSFKKNLPYFELLALLGDKKISKKINRLMPLIEEYENSIFKKSKIEEFIKDWDIDVQEIEFETLQIMTDYMKS